MDYADDCDITGISLLPTALHIDGHITPSEWVQSSLLLHINKPNWDKSTFDHCLLAKSARNIDPVADYVGNNGIRKRCILTTNQINYWYSMLTLNRFDSSTQYVALLAALHQTNFILINRYNIKAFSTIQWNTHTQIYWIQWTHTCTYSVKIQHKCKHLFWRRYNVSFQAYIRVHLWTSDPTLSSSFMAIRF